MIDLLFFYNLIVAKASIVAITHTKLVVNVYHAERDYLIKQVFLELREW